MTLDLKTKMQADLADVSERLVKAYERANAANERVAVLSREQNALLSAIAIMDGQAVPVGIPNTLTLGHREVRALPWEPISAPAQVVDGIIVEQGFKIGKDEQGNPTLVPDGINEPSNDVPPPPLPAMEIGDFAPDLPEAL